MSYTLGIDVGIASIGFAGINMSDKKILFCGSHIFKAAEEPKTGASLALSRRMARGSRRVIHRRRSRKLALLKLLEDNGFKTPQIVYKHQKTNVWQSRIDCHHQILSENDFARVLYHIAGHRGFQSNRKRPKPNDTEGKKAPTGAIALAENLEKSSLPTIGYYLASLEKIRNSRGSFDRLITRDLLREEIDKIFTAQRKFGHPLATETLKQAYHKVAFDQNPLQSSYPLVGSCSLEPLEKRAPKFSYSAELFVA
jgi:CRISPR-associated endonuclease Csn1